MASHLSNFSDEDLLRFSSSPSEIFGPSTDPVTNKLVDIRRSDAVDELNRRGRGPQQIIGQAQQQFGEVLQGIQPVLGQLGLTPAQRAAQQLQAIGLAPQFAQQQLDVLRQFGPQFVQQQLALQQQFAPQFQQLLAQARTAERTADIADVLGLAPQIQRIRAAGELPATTQIRDVLGQQILGQLQAGPGLTPEQERETGQQIRAAQIARGFGFGAPSALREGVQRAVAGLAEQRRRQQQAQSFLAQEAATTADPFAAILNRAPVTALAAAQRPAAFQVPAQRAVPTVLGAGIQALGPQLQAGLTAASIARELIGQQAALQLQPFAPS